MKILNTSTRPLFLLSLLLLVSCSTRISPERKHTNKKAKNLILMIADGMGPAQISLLYYTLKHSKNPDLMKTRFAYERMAKHSMGVAETAPYGSLVTDSAAAGTQIATGQIALPLTLGLNYKGEVAETIVEKAKKKGIATGLVSDTRMTHATPAAFAAHVPSRGEENEIALQMLETAPTVLLSGGANRFVPAGTERKLGGAFTVKSRREDDRDLLKEAADAGYHLSHSRGDLTKAATELEANSKILGLFSNHSYEPSLWFHQNKDSEKRTAPSLLEMSQSAVQHLSKSDNGFFLMIEGGQIDWAGHQNDSGSLLHEILSFNETMNWVIDWVEENPDTLLVVTADHETGGFGFSYHVQDIPPPTPFPGKTFQNRRYKPTYNFGDPRVLDQLYHQKETIRELWGRFQDLPKRQQTSNELRRQIHQATGFMLSTKETKKILETARNPRFDPNDDSNGPEFLPKIEDFSVFYSSSNNRGTASISRALAPYLGIVWGTGMHTATPVNVYTLGDFRLTQRFSGHMSIAEIGQRLQSSMGLRDD